MTLRIFLFAWLVAALNYVFAQTEIKKTIHFEFDHSTLSKEEKQKLDSVAQLAKNSASYTITLKGHTDGIGADAYNEALAQSRNRSVKIYLVSLNIDSSKIIIEGFGERKPLVENSNRSNRAQNRRVELTIIAEDNIAVNPAPMPSDSMIEQKGPEGIIVKYSGGSVGSVNISIISNTRQMTESNFTTMTENGQALTSNVMFCVYPRDPNSPCELKIPVTILIPINNNTSCYGPDARYYEAVLDSATGKYRWRDAVPDFKIVTIDGISYYEVKIRNACNPCKNFDCPKRYKEEIVKINSSQYRITEITSLYESSNGLLMGKKIKRRRWTTMRLNEGDVSDERMTIKAKDKMGKKYYIDLSPEQIKEYRKGKFVIKKELLKPDPKE